MPDILHEESLADRTHISQLFVWRTQHNCPDFTSISAGIYNYMRKMGSKTEYQIASFLEVMRINKIEPNTAIPDLKKLTLAA